MEQQQPINVLWQRLQAAEPAHVAARAAVTHDAAAGVYRVPFLGVEHCVEPAGQRVTTPEGAADFAAALICVQYLLEARDEPLADELVNPRSLPYGDFFFRGQHEMPTARLEQAFGDSPDAFRAAAAALGGTPVDMADAAAQFLALPRVPITVSLWAADDEFPARAQILLDRWVDHQLPLDALWLLGGLLARRLVAAGRGA
ncbi:DUF3786 domain-containing protein [bacterium]|nr:DUF3786 domain-containing protein [bacterium]